MKSWLPVLLLIGLWIPLLTILSIPEIPEIRTADLSK